MNKTQPFNEITIVFQNCENIIIDSRALRFLNFTGGQQSFFFKNNELHYRTELVVLDLGINTTNMDYFRHPVNDIGIRTDTNKSDGVVCFERLKESYDISALIINGTEYCVPWSENKHSNDWQKNALIALNSGEVYLSIEIQQPVA